LHIKKYISFFLYFAVIAIFLLPDKAIARVYISGNNTAIVDNKPFFPLGLYVGNSPSTDIAISELDEIADSPFNTILNYNINEASISNIRRYLDTVDRKGLKIIYSIKDFYEGTKYYPGKLGNYKGEDEMTRGIISEFKDHPAILAWYINDELPSKYIPRLSKRHKMVKSLDPHHPTWSVLFQVDELESYADTSDIIGADPYPVPQKSMSMASDWTKKVREAVGPNRAVWMVPQAHNNSLYSKENYRSPTFDEMRSMAYQCLVHGANGLVFYSFFDLKRDPEGFESRWSDLKKLGEEVKSLIPVLLSEESVPKVQLVSGSREIGYIARQYDGSLYIIAANSSDRSKDAEFSISAEVQIADVLFENRSVAIEKFRLRDTFSPIAVHIYKIAQ